MMHTSNCTICAPAARDLVQQVKASMQEINNDYISHIDSFDASTSAAYFGVTESSVCDYLNVVRNSETDLMILPDQTCQLIKVNWGDQGVNSLVIYGLQLTMENADNFTLYGNTIGCQPNDGGFLSFYYFCAFMLKPEIEYLTEKLQGSIESKQSNWKTTQTWMTIGLLFYLLLWAVGMVIWIFYLRNKYGHYTAFYTMLPKRIRERSESLKTHVADLISAAD